MDEIEKLKLLSDDEKIKALETLSDDFYKVKVILTLQDDDKKIKALEALSDEYDKARVIKTLQDDDEKIKALETLRDEVCKASVIETLQDDDKKIKTLKTLRNEDDKARVILTLQDDDKKIKALEILSDEWWKASVIETLQDDDKKIKVLETLSDEECKTRVIATLQDDDKKIKALEVLSDDGCKARVIKTLQDDDKKIKALEVLSDDARKTRVIVAIADDDKKIEALKTLSDEACKAEVIITLHDDNKKIKALETLTDEIIAIVVETLQDNNKPLKDSLLNNRNSLKENLLKENRTYREIGLDSRITIGMEIESEGAMSPLIKTIIAQKQRNGATKGWNAIEDGSLNDGVELVSPILTDSQQDIEDIYMVCSFLKKCGQRISQRCGGHIHIGADYLTSKEAYVNLFEIWGNAERIIYKMSNEIGTIPRMRLQAYAAPFSTKLSEAIESEIINLESDEDLEQFISEIQEVQDSRYSGLNSLNINNGKNTIEFRISDGTINPDTWIENARLYGRIVQISQRLSEIEKQPEHSEEDERLLSLKTRLKEEIPEQEKMEILLELLFSEEERKVYRERYISSSKLLAQIPDEENPFQEMEFNNVDFKKKKHSLDEFHNVAVNDRMGTTNEVTRETVQGVMTEDELGQANDKNEEEK